MKSEMIVGNNLFVAQNLFVILLDPAQERGKGIGEMDILNKKEESIWTPLLRAEDGAQTRDPQLGRLMLYQLSYFRK